MDKIRIVAKSYDDAINEAILKLETTSDNMLIEVEEEGSKGFLGLFSKPWILNISKKTKDIFDENKEEKKIKKVKKNIEEKENKETFIEKAKEESKVEENISIDIEKLKRETKIFLDNILNKLNIFAEYEFDIKDEDITITINSSDEMGILIGKRGQTLDSIQYLLSLYINKSSEKYIRIRLDTENYREKRQEKLDNLAKNIAKKVKSTRKAFKLEPMNPYERRIIHNALQSDKFVITKSEGDEPFRYIVILPRNNYNKKRFKNTKQQ